MLEQLYQVLRENNLYSKSFDEFLTQYQDDDYKKKVYNEVSKRGLYSKDYASFAVKYNTRPNNISQSSFNAISFNCISNFSFCNKTYI